MQTVILAVLPVLLAAAPQKLMVPHHRQPCHHGSFTVGNERWCLVRCVELTPTEDHLESCDKCKSLEVLYKPDSRQRCTEGCNCCGGAAVDCNKLLRGGSRIGTTERTAQSCCKCLQPEVEAECSEPEVVHQPPMKRAAPRRARIRAVILYHPKKSVTAKVYHPRDAVGELDRISYGLSDHLPDEDY